MIRLGKGKGNLKKMEIVINRLGKKETSFISLLIFYFFSQIFLLNLFKDIAVVCVNR